MNAHKRRCALAASMSVTQFDHGYWYATELKQFAGKVGIPGAARLRKDELEQALRHFLQSGTVAPANGAHPTTSPPHAPRDVDLGLQRGRRIVRYTNDPATKAFLEREAMKRIPNFRRRSGALYRLNRWREEQITRGTVLTYGALVDEYVRLTLLPGAFAQIPHGRYINFLSDFMANEPSPTPADAKRAWKELKDLECPKTYGAWVSERSRKR